MLVYLLKIDFNSQSKLFLLWAFWILIGTCFYASRNQSGWAKGFYMAINVGYSIGWGYPTEIDDMCQLFSVVYVLLGSSAVAAALAYFAQTIVTSSKKWYLACYHLYLILSL